MLSGRSCSRRRQQSCLLDVIIGTWADVRLTRYEAILPFIEQYLLAHITNALEWRRYKGEQRK